MGAMIESFFHPASHTFSYVVADMETGQCAVIDPVLDFDFKSGSTSTEAADQIVDFIRSNRLTVQWLLETHAHADHMSAAHYLKSVVGGQTAIGALIGQVQQVFKNLYNEAKEFPTDGSQFDCLFTDGDVFAIGTLEAAVMHTPGHTPACVSYKVGNALFVGDTLFMPDYGTARCDFPGGDARVLYQSIQRIYQLPGETELYMCHDYPVEEGVEPRSRTTVAEQRAHNVHVAEKTTEQQFAELREGRDAQLEMPTLILPSIQVNIRAGALPGPESNGIQYLKIPLNQF